MRAWIEDFVDEDTGEVVSIERAEVVIDRETILENEHIELILDSGVETILIHKDDSENIDYSTIFNTLQKIPQIPKKRLLSIFTDNCVMLNHLMKKQHEG